MDRLIDGVEALDGPLDDPVALAGNLRDLRRINRFLGGVRLSDEAIDALAAHRGDLSILDVGTGGADIPVALLGSARRRGRSWRVVGVDSRPEVLSAARVASPNLAAVEGLELQQGDGRALPFRDRSFDVVHASLVLHHLDPGDAARLLAEMARVARLGIVVNDLHRGRLAWIGAWLLGHLLTGNPLTRRDAPMSVQRAYTASEVAEMVRAADLSPVRVIRGLLGHRYAIAAVPRTELDGIGAGGMDGSD